MTEQKSFDEIKNLLVKIQKLVYSENASSFSAIDKDLLLSHLRKFYEETLALEVTPTINEPEKEPLSTKHEEVIQPEITPHEEIKENEEPVAPEPVKETPVFEEPIEKEYPKIAIGGNIEIEIPKIKLKEEQSPEVEIKEIKPKENGNSVHNIPIESIEIPKASPKPNFDDLVNKVKEQFDQTTKHQPSSFVPVDDDDEPTQFSDIRLDMLFDSIASKELSDRLSLSSIHDIGKSMGLNERIFTLNELFDGDNQIFEQTLTKLNNATNFDHAKEIISKEIANQFNWLAESKIKKARDFIKLVRRRYI
jgi:hypothetical protein